MNWVKQERFWDENFIGSGTELEGRNDGITIESKDYWVEQECIGTLKNLGYSELVYGSEKDL